MTGMMMEYIRKSVVMAEDDMINSDVQGGPQNTYPSQQLVMNNKVIQHAQPLVQGDVVPSVMNHGDAPISGHMGDLRVSWEPWASV
jgi:hypothetical protein